MHEKELDLPGANELGSDLSLNQVINLNDDQTDTGELSDNKHSKADSMVYRKRFFKVIKNIVYTITVISAFAILLTTLVFPVLRIYGNSMGDTLKADDMVVVNKLSGVNKGDVIAFYYNNKILVKRVVATDGDWVTIDNNGKLYVNQELLDEQYVTHLGLGSNDTKYPYQVPLEHYFVLGDDRESSIDSRMSSIGAIAKDQVLGKIVLRLYPFDKIGGVRER